MRELINSRVNDAVLTHDRDHLPRQHFQFSRAQIFFAELDVVDTGARAFGDFGDQVAAAGAFVAAKLASVGDVVGSGQPSLSAYYERSPNLRRH